ncbi:MAG: hypothetical protein JWQ63_2725 [Mucilaginibacter sp.]|jgi:hypothetical protein|nr:hypothetical protein [Mucilaginibacter sp.]
MKISLKIALFLIVFGSIVLSIKPVKAQCAQCAATIESNAKSGDKTANGLNKGILFLLAAPYLAVAAVGLVWYKKYRRKNVNINIRNEKLNLN